jgi:Fur family transcriptional regulator, ferric uptake regulator
MTAPPDSPPQVFDDVEDAIRSLRDSGLRISTARRLVLEALFAADGPVSAARLARRLSLDESSVYRNLELFEDRGLLRHLHLGHSPGLYVLASEHEVEYLCCEHCAKVTAVAPDRLDPIRKQIERRFGYTPRFTHFAIVGICQDCRDAPADTDEGRTSSPQHHDAAKRKPSATQPIEHEHLHSHGDYVHSHPHAHPDRARHTH